MPTKKKAGAANIPSRRVSRLMKAIVLVKIFEALNTYL